MANRSPQEIRASVETTRQELEYSLNDLQAKFREVTDWRAQLAAHTGPGLLGVGGIPSALLE